MKGRWVEAPGEALLRRLYDALGSLPLVAEDLGVITPQVEALRDRFSLPGMKVLQFAFGEGPENPHLPHNHLRNCVVYTGTHDNNTTLGWYLELSSEERREVQDYLGASAESMPWPLIRAAMVSPARLCVIPMQDLLALDGGHRMNLPGTCTGNWQWRFSWQDVPSKTTSRLRRMNALYGRLPPDEPTALNG